MSEFAYQVGQRVRETPYPQREGTVTYRYPTAFGNAGYVVALDEPYGYETPLLEQSLEFAPLRRGDTVQRDQADTIPEGTTVLCGCGYKKCLRQRFSDDEWARFGKPLSIQTDDMIWPVTIVDVPGGDES